MESFKTRLRILSKLPLNELMNLLTKRFQTNGIKIALGNEKYSGKLPGLVVNIKDSQPWFLDVSSIPGFA